MAVFLERFVLPILAAGVVSVIVLNPFKFDWHQKIGLLLAAIGLAYFVARTVHRAGDRLAPAAPVESVQPPTTQRSGAASTLGDSSPAITGNGNAVTYHEGEPARK